MIYAALDTVKERSAQNINDPVNAPNHYRSHPSGVECIQITEHMGFNLGNAVKYIWRADLKDNSIQDLEKAIWYVKREIQLRTTAGAQAVAGTSKTDAGSHTGQQQT